jgi:integrase
MTTRIKLHKRVKLYARVAKNGNYSRPPVTFVKGRPVELKPKSGYVTTYQIRIAGRFVDAGDNFQMAVTRLRQKEAEVGNGVTLAEAEKVAVAAPIVATPVQGRTPVVVAAEKFVNEIRCLDRDTYTVNMYANMLRDFQAACPRREFMEDVNREDVLSYLSWMSKNMPVRVKGSEARTYRNKLACLSSVLRRYGVQLKKARYAGANDTGLVSLNELPKSMKKQPRIYSKDEIAKLLSTANEDESDYIQFLNWTGFRDGEVMHIQYSDLNFRTNLVSIVAKPGFGWWPKDNEERAVYVPGAIMERLKARMTRLGAKPDSLVFPREDGRPDKNLINLLHAAGERAGVRTRGQRAGHKFRKTAGTRIAKKYGLPAAMKFLGHTSLETTILYLGMHETDLKALKQGVDEMYAAGD